MKKKTFMATIISVLLASTLTGVTLGNVANANPLPQNPVSPPPIVIQSPLNSTYYQNDVLLNFTIVNASTYSPMVYHLEVIYYRIDEKTVWLYSNPDNYQLNAEQFSANLTGLSKGEHTLTVYVDGGGLYYINNSSQIQGYSVETAQTVTFTVAKDLETTLSPAPSPTSSLKPEPHSPTIYIVSPVNGTIYETGDVPLTFTVTKPDSWEPYVGIRDIQYKLDPVFNGDFVTETSGWTDITPAQSLERTQQYSSILKNASDGNHSLMVRVRVEYPGGDVTNGVYAFFSVIKAEHSQQQLEPSPTECPSRSESPTKTPTIEPSQTPDRPQIKDFAPVIIPGSVILLATITVGLLFHFSKRRGNKQ